MQINILHQSLGRVGGGEKVTLNICRGLLRRGHDVKLFWMEWNQLTPSLKDSLLINNYPDVKKVAFSAKWKTHRVSDIYDSDVVLVTYHINPRVGWYLTHLHKTSKVPIVWYAGEPNRGLWEKWITGSENQKAYREMIAGVVAGIYGDCLAKALTFPPVKPLLNGFLRIVDYTYIIGFDYYICQSKATLEILKKIYKIQKEKMLGVIYPGIEDEGMGVERSFERLFLAVGALERGKNYFRMLKAFERMPNDFRLSIVGRRGRDNEAKELMRYKACNVNFLGWISDYELRMIYAHCQALVTTALWEPYGLSPVEAASYGKPSIVSNIGGVSETVIDGWSGLHVNPYRIEYISKAMMRMMDEKFCRRLGDNARRRFEQKFTLAKMAEKIEEKLEAIV